MKNNLFYRLSQVKQCNVPLLSYRSLLAFMLVCFSAWASAAPGADSKTTENKGAAQPVEITSGPVVNNKPVTIDADQQEIDIEKNMITFSGNVVVIQDNITVKANKVVITDMQDKNKQKITAYGTPVYFKQVSPDPKKTVDGHSEQLIYDVKRNDITLIGRAELFQQDNHVSSAKILYLIDKQQVIAQPGSGNRVKTTIIPNQVNEKN